LAVNSPYDQRRDKSILGQSNVAPTVDVAQSLLERTFSRNPTLCRAVLNFLLVQQNQGKDMSQRHIFRLLMQHLNRLGGMAVLDMLSQEDIEAQLLAAATTSSMPMAEPAL